MEESFSLESYHGLVAKVCWKHYRGLPMSVKMWFGIEDLINDCFVRLVGALPNYDPERGSPATFVRTVCTYHCLQILEFHYAQQRVHERQSLDNAMEAVLPSVQRREMAVLGKYAIETLLRRQDDPEIRRLVAACCGEHKVGSRIRLDPQRVSILRELFRACGITYSDFFAMHSYDLYPQELPA